MNTEEDRAIIHAGIRHLDAIGVDGGPNTFSKICVSVDGWTATRPQDVQLVCSTIRNSTNLKHLEIRFRTETPSEFSRQFAASLLDAAATVNNPPLPVGSVVLDYLSPTHAESFVAMLERPSAQRLVGGIHYLHHRARVFPDEAHEALAVAISKLTFLRDFLCRDQDSLSILRHLANQPGDYVCNNGENQIERKSTCGIKTLSAHPPRGLDTVADFLRSPVASKLATLTLTQNEDQEWTHLETFAEAVNNHPLLTTVKLVHTSMVGAVAMQAFANLLEQLHTKTLHVSVAFYEELSEILETSLFRVLQAHPKVEELELLFEIPDDAELPDDTMFEGPIRALVAHNPSLRCLELLHWGIEAQFTPHVRAIHEGLRQRRERTGQGLQTLHLLHRDDEPNQACMDAIVAMVLEGTLPGFVEDADEEDERDTQQQEHESTNVPLVQQQSPTLVKNLHLDFKEHVLLAGIGRLLQMLADPRCRLESIKVKTGTGQWFHRRQTDLLLDHRRRLCGIMERNTILEEVDMDLDQTRQKDNLFVSTIQAAVTRNRIRKTLQKFDAGELAHGDLVNTMDTIKSICRQHDIDEATKQNYLVSAIFRCLLNSSQFSQIILRIANGQ